MDDKTKLYVFEKKEVFLIFVFMILIAITSFLIGVKIGTKFSFEKTGFMDEDRESIEIQSQVEENVSAIAEKNNEQSEQLDEDAKFEELKKITETSISDKFENEFSNENKKFNGQKKRNKSDSDKVKAIKIEKEAKQAEVTAAPIVEAEPKDMLEEKYTIQLSAHRSVKEAEQFADAYKIRGYNPIISEKETDSGVWFRVSIGAFDNLADAKKYVLDNKSLFEGTGYIFKQFD